MRVINYKAEPTAQLFHASDKVVRGFKGCVGNGKSVTCIMEGLRLSQDQWPNCDGIRKSRGVIIRNTYPELSTTTLNTYKQWIPEEISPVVKHPYISTKIDQPLGDGTRLEVEIYFLALDSDDDVKKLLSLETTWIFLNEAKQLPYSVVKAARERIGRYPSVIDGYQDDPSKNYIAPRDAEGNYQPCKRKALMMDTNPPPTDHWWYQLAEEGCLRTSENKAFAIKETERIFDFFDGPSPLIKQDDGSYIPNPKAENIAHLPGGYQYYLDMIAGNTEDHINVQVMGNYGSIKTGKPVYPQFNDNVHVAKEHFVAIPDLPICLGWDFGLTPACTIGQLTSIGQARVIVELVSEDMDVRTFARDVVKPFLQKHFSKNEIGFSFGDPAGNNRGEGEGKTAIGILNDEFIDHDEDKLNMGFETEPAPTNDPTKRIDAVTRFLTKMVGSGQPGFVMDKRCKVLRNGFNGGYSYKRVANAGQEGLYKDKPDKNQFSHPHDSLQYLFLGFVGGYVKDNLGYNADNYEEYREPSNALGY